ncbi:MAG: electron transfer flavoprotein subunit beta/FixA family protein [bacterium]|nr:electron transfer flavoprotein subunit beta/FixA family protein [bacterium]
MDIIVCIKQVPDVQEVHISPDTNTLIREGVPSVINPFDLNAIEEALRLKERYGGKVVALSMGPPQVEESLREAISMGVTEGVLLQDKAFRGADTLATSFTLAKGIKKLGDFDLVLCGKQAIDGETAQVGPELGEMLNIPVVSYVRKIDYQPQDSMLRVERVFEDGYEVVEVPLPCLLTVTKEINEPRCATLRGVLLARNKEITVWGIKDLGISEDLVGILGSPTKVTEIFTPPKKPNREILEGDIEEIVDKLVTRLRDRKVI